MDTIACLLSSSRAFWGGFTGTCWGDFHMYHIFQRIISSDTHRSRESAVSFRDNSYNLKNDLILNTELIRPDLNCKRYQEEVSDNKTLFTEKEDFATGMAKSTAICVSGFHFRIFDLDTVTSYMFAASRPVTSKYQRKIISKLQILNYPFNLSSYYYAHADHTI